MDWKISVFLYVIVYSTSIIIQKFLLKDDKSEVISRSIFFQLITAAFLLIWSLITNSLNFNFDLSSIWYYLAIMIVAYGIGNALIFKSLQIGSAANFSIYFALRVLVNIIVAYFLFNQLFSPICFLGLAGILAGIIIVDYSPELLKISKAEFYTLIAALLIGSTNAISQPVLKVMNLNTFLFVAYLFPALFMMVIKPKVVLNLKGYFTKKHLVNFSILSFIQTIASIFFFHAIQVSNDSGLVTAISLSSIIVIVIFSYIFLKDREHFWRKLIAAFITFGGLLLLI